MNALDAAMTVFFSVLLVLIAIGIQSLQAWLEHSDYDRHFND
jgi:hypothetical protein